MFSYVVTEDHGFAPNPFHGFCTLATCKPRVRGPAGIGDWVVGIRQKKHGDFFVYVMRVEESMTFNEYWSDPRFSRKKPNLRGSRKQAFGDNIYYRDGGKWCQQNSHHSNEDGTVNRKNRKRDTGTDRVLIGVEYAYWGGDGPEIPEGFLDYNGESIRGGRGHRSRFPKEFIKEFVAWFRSLDEQGYLGRPLEWSKKR